MKRKFIRYSVVSLCILLLIVAGIFYLGLRYFYYSEYNVHAKKAVIDELGERYQEEFKLLDTEYAVYDCDNPDITGGAKYQYIWTFTFENESGEEFKAYSWGYGLSEFGASTDPVLYGLNIWDEYSYSALEKHLPQMDLQQYRQEVNVDCLEGSYYVIECTKENQETVADMLIQIFLTQKKLDNLGWIGIDIHNEEGDVIYHYGRWTVSEYFRQQELEVTEESLKQYFMGQIEGDNNDT